MQAKDIVRRNIVRIRQQKGWTQERLAFNSDVSKAGLCTIESGQRSPTVTTLEKIAKALKVPISEFFEETE